MRQRREPGYYLQRELPPTARPYRDDLHARGPRAGAGLTSTRSLDIMPPRNRPSPTSAP